MVLENLALVGMAAFIVYAVVHSITEERRRNTNIRNGNLGLLQRERIVQGNSNEQYLPNALHRSNTVTRREFLSQMMIMRDMM